MFPIDKESLQRVLDKVGVMDIATATIRQIVAVAGELEKVAGEKFVHLEIGNPGIPSETVGVEAECEALHSGVANKYPDIIGIPSLKKNASEFVKAFINLDIPPRCIIPTVGSMQGSFTLMTLLKMRDPKRDTMLLLYPGFPAQRHQAKLLGMEIASFDIYNYRGEALEAKLEEVMSTGRITAMLYSNPNNPAWTNLTEQELEIIGRMATKYGVFVLEDLAYMGMDFRSDLSHPFQAPYIPTVGRYTDNYILLLSGSKIFSYAGQRIAVVAMSPAVADSHAPVYEKFFEMPTFGDSYVYGVLYCASSGTSHSAQHALAAMMKAATEGKLNFIDHCREYGRRAEIAKRLFTDNGFHIVYDIDGDQPISDGFFFTVGYGDSSSVELLEELLRYGIATIALPTTGSEQEGLRVTVSGLTDDDAFEHLASRLAAFHRHKSAKCLCEAEA